MQRADVNPSDISTSYEPEWLFGYGKNARKQAKSPKSVVHIDQDGNIIKQEQSFNSRQRKSGTTDDSKNGFASWFGRKSERTSSAKQPNDTSFSNAGKYSASAAAADTMDTAVDFAIIDSIANGGKEVHSIFDGVKNIFTGSKGGVVDDIAGAGIAEGAGAKVMEDIGEHSSGFMDAVGDVFDHLSEGLSDAAESVGDILEGIV